MFQKILIANRGEIAVRIIRACREMGIKTVAVYSEADRDALHTLLADEAICIGPAPSAESYLNMEQILTACVAMKADAIHPGFGFLSENAKFAELCEKCHIRFIGPPAEVIHRMGNKSEARKTMMEAGVPVIPGSKEPVFTVEEGLKTGQRGGLSCDDQGVQRRRRKGDAGLLWAKTILRPISRTPRWNRSRDFPMIPCTSSGLWSVPDTSSSRSWRTSFGNVVHLGERDCSIQRRHQKLLEEAPSAAISEELRERMGQAAVKAARSVQVMRMQGPLSSFWIKIKNFISWK